MDCGRYNSGALWRQRIVGQSLSHLVSPMGSARLARYGQAEVGSATSDFDTKDAQQYILDVCDRLVQSPLVSVALPDGCAIYQVKDDLEQEGSAGGERCDSE